MKKVFIGLLALIMVLGLVGCSSVPAEETTSTPEPTAEATQAPEETPETMDEQESLEDYPIAGTWKAESESSTGDYWRIKENGEVTPEFVLERTSTSTVNGVTTSSSSKYVQTMPAVPYKIQGENFMYSTYPFKMTFDGMDYKLVGEEVTYVRVGELDYEIELDESENSEETSAEATAYVLGESIIAEGIEMTFSESGFSDDIRVSSKSSGIIITSGPSPESDKQFFYLKGTLKNTGKEEVFPAIGGYVTLDDYKYDIRIDLIHEDGTPCSTIEPLDSVIVLIYAHIPIELTESFNSGRMTFGFNDNFEDVDITKADYLYSIDAIKE